MIKEAINMFVNNITLSDSEMTDCMLEIMEGRATDAQIGAFLTALRLKGEDVAEITAAARVMRDKASSIKSTEGTLDTCGTGGDMAGTFNISTTTALVVAACGVPVFSSKTTPGLLSPTNKSRSPSASVSANLLS